MDVKTALRISFYAIAAAIMYVFGGGITKNVYDMDPVALRSVMELKGVELEGLISVGFGLGVVWAASGVIFIYCVCQLFDLAVDFYKHKKSRLGRES